MSEELEYIPYTQEQMEKFWDEELKIHKDEQFLGVNYFRWVRSRKAIDCYKGDIPIRPIQFSEKVLARVKEVREARGSMTFTSRGGCRENERLFLLKFYIEEEGYAIKWGEAYTAKIAYIEYLENLEDLEKEKQQSLNYKTKFEQQTEQELF